MGQGFSAGAVVGVAANIACGGLIETTLGRAQVFGAACAAGLAIDITSDVTARKGKLDIEREVMLNASDSLKHVYSFYVTNDAHPVAKLVRQKHEWLVLESHTHRFYTVQKWPGTGDVAMHSSSTLRGACDWGLRAAHRPTHGGEIRQYRDDMDFDVPDDLQVAYVIAWARKEDPRWAFSTENSKHFTMRLRFALHDF
jgi:hypothetical protein